MTVGGGFLGGWVRGSIFWRQGVHQPVRCLAVHVPSQCRRCIGVTSVKSGLAMKSGCVKSREPHSLRLCSRRQEEPASLRPPSSSCWPHYLPSDWMSRTAWRWPGCGRDYHSVSCAPPSPASEARGGSLTSTRKSCIPALAVGQAGLPTWTII